MNRISAGLMATGLFVFAMNANAATYPAQDCVAKSGALTYSSTNATNYGASAIGISCPFARMKDGSTTAAGAVAYFNNDGKTKSCFLDNYSIDTGGLLRWTSASGVTRLVLPAINPTSAWQPMVLNCSLPAGSRVHGYYLSE